MILLTGASGFIGKHLFRKLTALYGYDNVVALTGAAIPHGRYILHNNYNFSDTWLADNGIGSIDVVIHAGAFTPKNAREANDWAQCDTNIINTHNLLNALPAGVQKIVFLSTLDVYGEADVISEKTPVQPVSLYGHSKLYGERQVEQWAVANSSVYQLLRIGHVYGPGEEKYEKIIPNTIRRIQEGLSPKIVGTGKDIRTFIYINDAVDAIAKSIELTENIGPVNITGSIPVTITDIVSQLLTIAGKPHDIEYISSDRPGRNLYFDSSKMHTTLGVEKYDLQAGLTEEWLYMLNNRK